MRLRRLRRWVTRAAAPWPLTPPPLTPAGSLTGPPLTVVVISYEMRRQLANTLVSLLPPYQQQIDPASYAVHVVDNGSKQPLDRAFWALADNVRYQYVPPGDAPVNPGIAINRAVTRTHSPLLCLMIDGARMLSPGVLHWGVQLANLSPRTIVEVRGWHLGVKLQHDATHEQYNEKIEQQVLSELDWLHHGYRLFEIAVPAASMPGGFFGTANECTCLLISRSLFDELGGYDERYATPGGALCNADFFVRAVQHAERVFTLLGEGTFHQIHGGAATGLTGDDRRATLRQWRDEYERLSRPWHRVAVDYQPLLAGHVPAEARKWLAYRPAEPAR